MYTIQQILSLSTSVLKIAQPHNNLINFSNLLVKKEFGVWSNLLLNSITKDTLLNSMSDFIFITNRLPNFEYMLLSRQVDEIYPGFSFNFICNSENIKGEEYSFFLYRLCAFRDSSLLLNIYEPSRLKLAEVLLEGMKFSKSPELFKVSDDEIIFCFEEIMKDWQKDEPPIFLGDKVKIVAPELNGKKIYLRKSLK